MLRLSLFLEDFTNPNASTEKRKYTKNGWHPFESHNRVKISVHSTTSESPEFRNAMASFTKSSNQVNPHEVPLNESSTDKSKREKFHHQIRRAIGRGSDSNGISVQTKDSVSLFRGQAHPPRIDRHGHVTFDRPTSWSTHPGVAHQLARKNSTAFDTSAHHIIELKHQRDAGHRIVSLSANGHGGHHNEEEVVSAPGKYHYVKSEHLGIDEKTGKPVIKHTIEFSHHHPDWDGSKSGDLSEEEHKLKSDW